MFLLIILFIIITISGYVLTRTLTNETDSFIILPVSQITGSVFYIFLLNLVSKIIPGPSGIVLSTIGLIVISFMVYRKYKKNWTKLESLVGKEKLFFYITILTILAFSSLKMFTMLPAADSSMQWAYAASFAKGNNPMMTPWQPDLTPNYHLGAYFLEGALFYLTGTTFTLIHTIFNIFLMLSGSLMVVFILWKKGGNVAKLWSYLAVLIFYICFGVIVLSFPNFSTNSQITNLSDIKMVVPAKGQADASLVDLNMLSILPARSLSIGIVLVALFFVNTRFKNKKIKILSFSILFAISALVEESMFIPMIICLTAIFVMSLFSFIPRLEYIKSQRKPLFIILVLTTFMVIFQGGFITDNIFRAERKTEAFRIFNPLSNEIFFNRLSLFKDFYIKANSNIPFAGWLVPSPFWFLLILLAYSYYKKDPITGSIGLFAASTFALFLFTDYQYCSGCSIRLHSFGYIALGFGIFFIIIDLLKNASRKQNTVALLLFMLIVLIPSLASDLIYQNSMISEGLMQDKISVILTPWSTIEDDIATWASKNIPPNERFIIIDESFPSPGGVLRFQYHGLYTILGPQNIRVNRQEPGVEFYDLALTLNPSLLKKTKTKFIYIDSNSKAYVQLPEFRKRDLENINFFQKIKTINNNGNFYELLQALPLYFDKERGGKEIKEGKIDELMKIIPHNSSVYLGDYGDSSEQLNFWYRMPFAYIFADGNYDLVMNESQTTYQVIEITMHRRFPKIGELYDYYILGPTKKPDFKAELIWSNVLASAWKRI